MGAGGVALKFGSTALYALEFCCAGIILGFYSYFLAVQADRDSPIPRWQQAVEGMSGAVVLYTIFGVLLTCCLGGKTFFGLLGIVFDVLCCGAMVAIAVLTRDGAHSCSGYIYTPLGEGPANRRQGWGSYGDGNKVTYATSLKTACRFNKVCFAVAIIGAFLFLISILFQLFLVKNHKQEKAFGPGPSNGYTKGSGVKFWQRNRKAHRTTGHRDPEVGTVPATGGLAPPATTHDYRASHDTAYTGSTVNAPGAHYESNKPVVGGYHTAPTGTYQTTGTATNY